MPPLTTKTILLPPSSRNNLHKHALYHSTMPHFRPLMLLANRLSSIQSILSFERWEGYHHFEDEKVSLGPSASEDVDTLYPFP